MAETKLNPDGPDIADPALGLPGPAEPLPKRDHLQQEPTLVNDTGADGDPR